MMEIYSPLARRRDFQVTTLKGGTYFDHDEIIARVKIQSPLFFGVKNRSSKKIFYLNLYSR